MYHPFHQTGAVRYSQALRHLHTYRPLSMERTATQVILNANSHLERLVRRAAGRDMEIIVVFRILISPS